MLHYLIIVMLLLSCLKAVAQEVQLADTVETRPLKLTHAEPLYIDLIRDLGAHKGEKEWNIGAGLTDNLGYDRYEFLVEYEWAPINRLGLEVEVPVSLYTPNISDLDPQLNRPADRIESLKLAAQYTFLVSDKYQTSMALGTITEFELADLNRIGKDNMVKGFLLNPFLVMAKRWGSNMHSLVYTGPRVLFPFHKSGTEVGYEINSSVHYMIPNSRNFIGLELNKEFSHGEFHMVARPQMRITIDEGLMIGVVPGIPIIRGEERLSSFVRLIYEPRHRK
ncbi:HAEPLYID family protein [Pontibacter pamirensis]|uniref:HAEPLYID family protein n=1 Tax=Pontibacter pamirensis TaxID=2562824 RepID=UPI001389F6B2|nr:HAEPLYID family protein [Pontibacter pamirensis]